jgi:hypothetical protein
MPETRPSSGGCYPIPSWWTEPRYNLSEIAHFLQVPIATIHLWIKLARATGLEVGDASLSRPLYSAHQIFALALLAKLHAINIRINADTIASAFAFANVGIDLKPIPHDAIWTVIDEAGAVLQVQSWIVFSAVRHFAQRSRYI